MALKSTIKDFVKTIIPNNLMVHRLPQQADNSIVLTFDDGPDSKITPLVLERLEQYNARAIFFVIGQKVEAHPKLFNDILDKGHVIGNHTYTHSYQQQLSITRCQEEILRCQELVQQKQGYPPVLYRPPKGVLSPSALYTAKKMNLTTVLWSIEGGEWGVNKQKNETNIGNTLKQNIQPRDIVLLHDNNNKMPRILDILLPNLKQRGIDLFSGVKYL